MRFNNSALCEFALGPGDQEGRMYYRPPEKSLITSGSMKEKWFKLKKNLLFYYRLNESGVIDKEEPRGVFILENIVISEEKYNDPMLSSFSITWKDEPFKKHLFFLANLKIRNAWIAKIYQASYESLQNHVKLLRKRIIEKTGEDPLKKFGIPLKDSKCTALHPVRRDVTTSNSKFYSSPSYSASTSDLQKSSVLIDDLNNFDNKCMATSTSSAPTSPVLKPAFSGNLPTPPPRQNRDRRRHEKIAGSNHLRASLRSHLQKSEEVLSDTKASFKSHIKDISHLL